MLEKIAQMGGSQGLSGITGPLKDIFGSSSSETTKVDQKGMDYLLQKILEQGYADVRGASRRAGAYDSDTEELMVNDFLARAAGEVAGRNTTTSTSDGGLLGQLGGLFGLDIGGGGGGGLLGNIASGGLSGIVKGIGKLF